METAWLHIVLAPAGSARLRADQNVAQRAAAAAAVRPVRPAVGPGTHVLAAALGGSQR